MDWPTVPTQCSVTEDRRVGCVRYSGQSCTSEVLTLTPQDVLTIEHLTFIRGVVVRAETSMMVERNGKEWKAVMCFGTSHYPIDWVKPLD